MEGCFEIGEFFMKIEIYPLDRVELDGRSIRLGMKRTNDVQNIG